MATEVELRKVEKEISQALAEMRAMQKERRQAQMRAFNNERKLAKALMAEAAELPLPERNEHYHKYLSEHFSDMPAVGERILGYINKIQTANQGD